MSKNQITLRDILADEFLKSQNIKLRDSFNQEDVLKWLERNYPNKYKKKTVYNYLTKLSTNCPGRVKGKWPITKGKDDLFFKLKSSTYRLYEKNNDKRPYYTEKDIERRNVNFDRKLLTPTNNDEELDLRVNKLLKYQLKEKPKGNQVPQKSETTNRTYFRDPHVKAWVLQEVKGICELCDNKAPFNNSSGNPYLEVHHILSLADKGADTIHNTVALCPNCHRKCHYSDEVEQIKGKLTLRTQSKRKNGKPDTKPDRPPIVLVV